MYQAIYIKNFRCFEDLRIENLGQINLIVGKNNIGKSALLEGLYLLGNYSFPERVARLSPWRGLEEVEWFEHMYSTPPWEYWFSGFDKTRVVELSCESAERHRWGVKFYTYPVVELSQPVNEAFSYNYRRELNRATQTALLAEATGVGKPTNPARIYGFVYDRSEGKIELEIGEHLSEVNAPFLPTELLGAQRGPVTMEAIQRFSTVVEQKRLGHVIRALQQIEPSTQDVHLVYSKKSLMLFCDTGSAQPIPLALMGDGMLQMFHLSALITTVQDGVALIDEIENGLHYSVHSALWEVVAEAAQAANAQVFATTHSYECIQAAVETFAKRAPNLLRVHRLERIDGCIQAHTLDVEMIEAAIDMRLEVR